MATRDSALSPLAEPQPAAPRARRSGSGLALVPALGLLAVLYLWALVGALRVSLLPLGSDIGGVSLAAWRQLFADPTFVDALVFTLKITVVSAARSERSPL